MQMTLAETALRRIPESGIVYFSEINSTGRPSHVPL